MKPVIAKKLFKKYDGLIAVDRISFEIEKGEIFGILGPNGAGKTTTCRMIYCFFPPDDGELYVLGMDVKKQKREIKRRIGVVPQENNLDPDFSVIKNLLIYASYFGINRKEAKKRAIELMKEFEIFNKKDEIIEHLSGGMKRRLVIARAFINDPELIIFDEPTTGLDPQLRHYIWEKIKLTKEKGKTVIITTHYMEEAEYLCDRVAIMDKGRILVIDSPKNLIKKFIGKRVIEIWTKEEKENNLIEFLKKKNFRFDVHSKRIFIYLDEDEKVPDIVYNHEHTIRESNLEDVFLKLTGRKLNGD